MKKVFLIFVLIVALFTVSPLSAQLPTDDNNGIDGTAEIRPVGEALSDEPVVANPNGYYISGGIVTDYGMGYNGDDASRVQTGYPVYSELVGMRTSDGYTVADDFTVTSAAGWYIDTIEVPIFQPDAGLPSFNHNLSTMTIYDGRPGDAGANIVMTGDADGISAAHAYRDCSHIIGTCSIGSNTRRLGMIRFTFDQVLPQGTYWWAMALTVESGNQIYAIPRSGRNTIISGNMRWQSGGLWYNIYDNGVPVGLPFEIYYTVNDMGIDWYSPTGIIESRLSSIWWHKVAEYSWYRNRLIQLSGISGSEQVMYDQWVAEDDSCYADDPECYTVVSIPNGTYRWERQAWGEIPGMSITEFSYFTLQSPHVQQLTPTFPTEVNQAVPVISWISDNYALWYHLYLTGPNGVITNTWYHLDDICVSGICSVELPVLQDGNYRYWIAGWGSAGTGPYNTQPHLFTVNQDVPGAPTLVAPISENITVSTVKFEWKPEPNTLWYHLQASGGTTTVDEWYHATDVCNPIICGVFQSVTNGSYNWSIETWGAEGFGPETTATFTVNAP